MKINDEMAKSFSGLMQKRVKPKDVILMRRFILFIDDVGKESGEVEEFRDEVLDMLTIAKTNFVYNIDQIIKSLKEK